MRPGSLPNGPAADCTNGVGGRDYWHPRGFASRARVFTFHRTVRRLLSMSSFAPYAGFWAGPRNRRNSMKIIFQRRLYVYDPPKIMKRLWCVVVLLAFCLLLPAQQRQQ